jgi:hypothetical protein
MECMQPGCPRSPETVLFNALQFTAPLHGSGCMLVHCPAYYLASSISAPGSGPVVNAVMLASAPLLILHHHR